MGAGVETYDWIANPDGITTVTEGDDRGLDTGTATPVHAGDIGQVRTPLASISGMVFSDTDNNGIRAYVDVNGNGIHDEGDADNGFAGMRIAIERYTVDASEQPDGSFAVAADAAWTRDETWATNWNDYDIDPVANPLENATLGLSRETTSGADGSFSFGNLPAYQRTVAEDGTQTITLYGYRLRVVDYRFWDKFLSVAKYQEGTDYRVDSDVVAETGYLMEDGQYDVLLNVITNESPVTNHLTALGSKNENQNDVDLYGLGDGSGNHGFTPPASAKTAATLTYDLGLGANRASNDAGVRMPPKAEIAGRLFNDATYDGLDRVADDEAATVTLDPGYNNKMVLLKQWYWVPSESGDGTGQWRLNESFGNDLYTRAFANADAVKREGRPGHRNHRRHLLRCEPARRVDHHRQPGTGRHHPGRLLSLQQPAGPLRGGPYHRFRDRRRGHSFRHGQGIPGRLHPGGVGPGGCRCERRAGAARREVHERHAGHASAGEQRGQDDQRLRCGHRRGELQGRRRLGPDRPLGLRGRQLSAALERLHHPDHHCR